MSRSYRRPESCNRTRPINNIRAPWGRARSSGPGMTLFNWASRRVSNVPQKRVRHTPGKPARIKSDISSHTIGPTWPSSVGATRDTVPALCHRTTAPPERQLSRCNLHSRRYRHTWAKAAAPGPKSALSGSAPIFAPLLLRLILFCFVLKLISS